MKTERTELMAGTAAFLTAVIVFCLIGTSSFFHKKADSYVLTARFNQTDGLAVGNEVRLAGIKVGHVLSLRLDDYYGVEATFSVPDHILLPSDSGAAVQTDGLLGKKYIELMPGGDDETLSAGDAIEFTQDSPDLTALLDKVVSMAKANRQKEKKEKE